MTWDDICNQDISGYYRRKAWPRRRALWYGEGGRINDARVLYFNSDTLAPMCYTLAGEGVRFTPEDESADDWMEVE